MTGSSEADRRSEGWILRGSFDDVLLVRPGHEGDRASWTRERPAPWDIERWLEDPFARSTLLDVYEALTGRSQCGGAGLSVPYAGAGDPAIDGAVVRAIVDALDMGELVARIAPAPSLFARHVEPEPPPPRPVPTEDWIVIRLVGEDRRPIAGQTYRVTLPGGAIIEGVLGSNGEARIDGIASGHCKVEFPDLHPNEWAPGTSQ
ncbi:hypothetical protein [Pendulispora albinea]|uniref:Uncharacterized protein n=1 Tax=Pendulispora albinea TaxID=2741071 RepID=A0ABZ2M914_9BACT